MTREEAIEHGKEQLEVFGGTHREFIEMAIKALEQEPCEDAISRQAVLELIADYDLSMGQVVRGIHALPSVTPQEPVLDKIRDQLKSNLRGVEITLEVLVENDPLRPKMEGAKCTLEDCLELIDRAESEDKK